MKKENLIIFIVLLSSLNSNFYKDVFAQEKDRPKNIVPAQETILIKMVLFPIKKATVCSRVDSVVKEYTLKEGEVFKEDQILAKFDDVLYKQGYIKAKERADFANTVYVNNLKLVKQGGVGQYELAKSKFDLSTATADLKISQYHLNSCILKAPFTGRLIKKIVSEHEFVRTGQPVIEIIDDSKLLAVGYLPSLMKGKIKKGSSMKCKIDEINTIYDGEIYEISGKIDPRSRTFAVKVIIDNDKRTLSAGMSGNMIIAKELFKNN